MNKQIVWEKAYTGITCLDGLFHIGECEVSEGEMYILRKARWNNSRETFHPTLEEAKQEAMRYLKRLSEIYKTEVEDIETQADEILDFIEGKESE